MRRSSEETKVVILASARERFAADGYDRATIRSIAADANIDPAMVMRYFGTKEQLFATAAEYDLELPDLGEAPRDQVGRTLVAHFLDRWEDDDESLRILLRTAVTNEEVAQRMRQILADQLAPEVAKLGGDPAGTHTRAGLAATQLLGLGLCRYVLRIPPVVAMGHHDVVGWLGPTLQRYLVRQAGMTP